MGNTPEYEAFKAMVIDLSRKGSSARQIAARIGRSLATVNGVISRARRNGDLAMSARWWRGMSAKHPGPGHMAPTGKHPNFTSAFMGDPLPGYSALDRKNKDVQQSIRDVRAPVRDTEAAMASGARAVA
jgi:hypothetical protein